MGQLFDKPMSELREAFVRARFAEPAMFGRADITEWLANPEWTGTINFDRSLAFRRHFNEALEDLNPAEELERSATPANEIPDWMLHRVHNKMAFKTIVKALRTGKAKIYYPWVNYVDRNPVAVLHGWVFTLAHTTVDGSIAALKTATVRDVLEILNAEIDGARPKADAARTFLNRMARTAVANAREDAERDFDEAVAVSADGTQIVKADWVVVIEKGYQSGRLYPSTAFQQYKILIYSFHSQRKIDIWRGDMTHFLARFMTEEKRNGRGGATYLITDQDGQIPDFGNVYVVDTNIDPQRLPSTLPDGGREILV